MQERKWQHLLQYWRDKHAGETPPARIDLDPVVEIPTLVSKLLLIDIMPEGYRYRLIGTEIVSRLGYDLTGKLLTQGNSQTNIITAFSASVAWVVEEVKPRLLLAQIFQGAHAQSVLLLLPLVAASGQVEIVLGGWFFDSEMRSGTRLIGISVVDDIF